MREPEGRAVVEPGVQWQNQNKHKQHKYGHVQQTTVPDYCKVNSLVVSITTYQKFVFSPFSTSFTACIYVCEYTCSMHSTTTSICAIKVKT